MTIVIEDKSDNESIIHGFENDKVVIKITKGEDHKPYHMVITKSDYEKRIYTHVYNPLFYQVNFNTRISYLYGCLNHIFDVSQEEPYYFWSRQIGTNKWNLWFSVHPNRDNIFSV